MGVAYWPGVRGMVSCQYTVSHDAQAGVATLVIPEQDVREIRSFGDLVISDGVNSVTLKRCKIADIQFSEAGGPRTITLCIVDRRWQWRYGSVCGNWNQLDPYPDPDLFPPGEYVFAGGPYTPGTYRPVPLMMADCLEEMGETMSGPGAPLIEAAEPITVSVQWDDEVPASALSSLCAQTGYRLVFQPIADRVLVAVAGEGSPLPDLPMAGESASIDLPERPNDLRVVCGPTLYNDIVELEPVGFEKNGAIRPINFLSYAPANGWLLTNPYSFKGEQGGNNGAQATFDITEDEAIALAKRHIWRTFRVKMVNVEGGSRPGPFIGGYGLVDDRKQIVLKGEIYGSSKSITGQPDTEPAFAMGRVHVQDGIHGRNGLVLERPGAHSTHTEYPPANRLPFRPQIDGERGLVTFDRQMFEFDVVGGLPTWAAPRLFIRTAMHIRDIVGRVYDRVEIGRVVGGLVGEIASMGCPPQYIKHPELVCIVNTVRKDADFSVAAIGDNLDDITPAAEYYLDAEERKYVVDSAGDRTYAGIVPIDPDGAIQQVTWSVGGGQPATTRASRNCEHAQYLASYPERRRAEDYRSFVEKLKKSDAADNAPDQARPWFDGGDGVGHYTFPDS